jgi:hypothetical protein
VTRLIAKNQLFPGDRTNRATIKSPILLTPSIWRSIGLNKPIIGWMSAKSAGLASEAAMKTVLVTGVRGKTGRQIAAALTRQPGIEVRGAGRNVTDLTLPAVRAVHFDWEDPAGWLDVLNGVSAIYLVKPKIPDPASTVMSFLRLAGEDHRSAYNDRYEPANNLQTHKLGLKQVFPLSRIGCDQENG